MLEKKSPVSELIYSMPKILYLSIPLFFYQDALPSLLAHNSLHSIKFIKTALSNEISCCNR